MVYLRNNPFVVNFQHKNFKVEDFSFNVLGYLVFCDSERLPEDPVKIVAELGSTCRKNFMLVSATKKKIYMRTKEPHMLSVKSFGDRKQTRSRKSDYYARMGKTKKRNNMI